MLGKALLSASVSAPPAVYVEDVFNTYLYTGTGSTPQTLTTGVNLADNKGMVLYRSRFGTFTYSWQAAAVFSDLCWGTKYIRSVQDSSGNPSAQSYDLETFGTSGITLNYDYDQYNRSGNSYAAYTFRNADKFFQAYNGVVNMYSSPVTISFPTLNTLGMVVVQGRDANSAVDYIYVWHRSLSAGKLLKLNTADAQLNSSFITVSGTDVTLDPLVINPSGAFGVNSVYAFAHDAGGYGASGNDSVVSCGSFTTDGSGNATVDLGWEPQWLLIKKSSTTAGNSTDDWFLYDNMRGASLTDAKKLAINTSDLETTNTSIRSLFATGFTWSGSASVTYVYIAIRRGPMKTPTDATKVFKANTYTGNGSLLSITGVGFPPDFSFTTRRDSASWVTTDKLRGAPFSLYAQLTAAEVNNTIYEVRSYDQDGVTYGQNSIVNGSSSPLVNYLFRRAPGFFDVVAYTGTGVARTVSHNLGVAPEFYMIKCRSAGSTVWIIAGTAIAPSTDNYLLMPNTGGVQSGTNLWQTPTFTTFGIGTGGPTDPSFNANGSTYIAYLFASCLGVSKVGTYTGTGTTLQINCNFTAGARFVLIKRTDFTGDWYVWDSARGIISGNDPYLLLNSTAAEVTNTDYIDPLSSGFQISSTAPAAINASGGSFIFLAIA